MPYPSMGFSNLNRERPKFRAKNLPKILEIRKSVEMQRDWWVQGKMWQGQLMQSIHYHKTAAKTGAHIQLSPSINSEAQHLIYSNYTSEHRYQQQPSKCFDESCYNMRPLLFGQTPCQRSPFRRISSIFEGGSGFSRVNREDCLPLMNRRRVE